jgi:hypothetical protein
MSIPVIILPITIFACLVGVTSMRQSTARVIHYGEEQLEPSYIGRRWPQISPRKRDFQHEGVAEGPRDTSARRIDSTCVHPRLLGFINGFLRLTRNGNYADTTTLRYRLTAYCDTRRHSCLRPSPDRGKCRTSLPPPPPTNQRTYRSVQSGLFCQGYLFTLIYSTVGRRRTHTNFINNNLLIYFSKMGF